MLWIFLIVGSALCCAYLFAGYRRLSERVAQLEISEMALGFSNPSYDFWEGVEAVDSDLPDMAEGVMVDDLT